MKKTNDFGRDSIPLLVLKISIPFMFAQFVNVLYSIVDRIYVGNIPVTGADALAGVGVCAPGAPGGAGFLRVQVPNPPGSGKDIAEGKGVYREVESEGSRMWGTPTNPRANLWSDGQKPHRRLYMRVSLPDKMKPDSYTES